jgi:peptide/nickel transport system substrate-binding protein
MQPHSIPRRRLLQSGAAAGLGLMLPGAAFAADAPIRGGTLTCSVDVQPKSLDPIMGDAPTSDRYSLLNLYEGLLRFDGRGSLEPALAESWDWNADATAITFKLRRGVVFHDGTPFDAEAAAFNLRRTIDPAVNAPRRGDLADIRSVDVLDPASIRVNLKATSGAALASLAVEAGMMCSPAAVKKFGADFGRNPVGTGPFKFVEWIAGTGVKMARNDRYWRIGADKKPLPYLDGIYLRFITNTAVKMVEVKSGNVMLTDTITPKDFEEVAGNKSLVLVTNPVGISQWVAFNVTKPPFNNHKLRAAFNAAIDREGIMKAVTRGFGQVTPTLIAPADWAFDGSLKRPKYDPALARQLLAESGVGANFNATMSIIQRDPDTQVAQFIQAQLRNVGVTMKIEVLERQAFVPKVLGYQYELAMGRINVPRADPDHVFGPFFGAKAAQNWAGFKNEGIFDAVDLARREVDRAKRKVLYSRAQRLLLEEDYYAFLFFRDTRLVANRRVQNLKLDIGGAWLLADVWLAKG